MQFPLTSIDTETVPFRKGCMAPPLVGLSYADVDGRVGILHHTDAAPMIKRLLRGGAVIVGHNVAYDWAVLMAHDPSIVGEVFEAYDSNLIHDTLVREQLIDLRRGLFRPGRYSLAETSKRRLDLDLSKDEWRLWYANLRDKPLEQWPDGAKRYMCDDAIATRDVYLSQEADGAPADQHNQTRAALWLHLCGAWGIKTDPKRVDELAGALEAERDQLLVTLKAEGLVRANGTRNMRAVEQRVREAYEKQGDETPAGGYAACPTTPTGKPKTDAATCDASGDDVLKKYGRLGEVNSKLNNYVPVLRMGTVHARYGLAETGRTTCLAGGSLVKTLRGDVAIQEVQTDDLVWTHRGRWRRVSRVLQQGLKPTISLSLSNGNVLTCTTDHLLLTQDGWKEAKHASKQEVDSGTRSKGPGTVPRPRESDYQADHRTHGDARGERSRCLARLNAARRIPGAEVPEIQCKQNRCTEPYDRENRRATPWLEGRPRESTMLAETTGATSVSSVSSSLPRLPHGDVEWPAPGRTPSGDDEGSRGSRTALAHDSPPHRRGSSQQLARQSGTNDAGRAQTYSLLTGERFEDVVITQVHPGPCTEVYDLSVEDDESFVAQGVFVHNCTIYLGKGNLQNLPRSGGVRECFAPRRGHVFAGADYDGLELRTVAQSCLKLVGHSELAKALNAGLDPHLALAAQILGIDYDSAKARKKAGDKEIDNARQTAKVANFGFPGGLGAERFVEYAKGSYGVDISVERARELKQQWLQRWPEFVAYFRHIDVTDQVTHLFSGRVRGGDVPYTVAANSFFQGLGADAAKRAGWLLCRSCYSEPKSPLFGSRIVLFAHDEFLLEVPDDERADPAAREMARLMCEGANQFLPDVPATTEPCLMKFYSKDAKSVYDDNGRLVAWPQDC